MSAEISDYVDVYARAVALHLAEPAPLAILPRGFDSAASQAELAHEAEASTLRKVWRDAGVEVHQVQPASSNLPSVLEHSSDWLTPTIFMATLLFSQSPTAIQLALGVLESYVVDVLKRLPGPSEPTVKLTFVVEQKGTRIFKKLDYEGPIQGLGPLEKTLRRLHDGQD